MALISTRRVPFRRRIHPFSGWRYDIVGAIADVHVAVSAFRTFKETVRAAITARQAAHTAAELREANRFSINWLRKEIASIRGLDVV